MINAYDFDGVISIGINPSSTDDVIITGRCIDESKEVYDILRDREIHNAVFFNPIFYAKRGDKTKESWDYSAKHKVITLQLLQSNGISVDKFFEDNKHQAKFIKSQIPDIDIVLVKSELVKL